MILVQGGGKVTLSGLFLPFLPHYHIILNLARCHLSLDLCLQTLYKEWTMKCRSWEHRVPRLELTISHWDYTRNKTSPGIKKGGKVVNSAFGSSSVFWLSFEGMKKNSPLPHKTLWPAWAWDCPLGFLSWMKISKDSSSEITEGQTHVLLIPSEELDPRAGVHKSA